MYEQFFGFSSRPFISTPNVQSYFAGESIHHALSSTRMCIERAAGPVVVTGSSGSGKSLLIAMLSKHFACSYSVVNVICGNMRERRDLLQAILFELKLPYKEMSEGELRLSLIDHLKTDEIGESGLLVLIDDAHDLPVDLLDELRVITNLVRDGRPMVSLVIVGQPSLEDHLIETKSESLNQRIAARCYLNSFTQNETFEYISTQIERAGGNGDHLFTGDALKSVHQSSGGCPRIINQISDFALVLAASQGSQRVTAEIVNEAWRDVQSIPGSAPSVMTYDQNDFVDSDSVVSVTTEFSTDVDAGPSNETNDVEGSARADENLMVIEFGQLDDDDGSVNDQVVEISAMESEDIDVAQALAGEFSDDMGCAQLGTDESSCNANFVTSELSDSSYSQDKASTANDDQDRVRGFVDPFGGETFAEEEIVKASFIPEVSEQNLNSLTLSTNQLSILESIDTDYSPMNEPAVAVKSGVSIDSGSLAVENVDLPMTIQEAMAGDNIESIGGANEDLRVSSKGLASLEQIADDIKRLQRDMRFSEEQYKSQAAHPDYRNLTDDQPIEELMQSFSATDSTDLEVAENSTIPMPQIVVESTETDDDQDMILSEPAQVEKFGTEDPLNQAAEEVVVSTGNAERMDYLELFRQLRSG